jgi:hypothetical protein
MISDLYRRRIQGVRKNLFARGASDARVISANHKMQYATTPVTVAIDGVAAPIFLNAPAAGNPAAANGVYLFFEDGWSTMADLTRACRIAVGGDYAGCLYSVFDVGGGTYKCIHTARPSGVNAEASVALMANYAMQQGWRLVHQVPTKGLVGQNGCDLIYIATRVSYTVAPRPVVRTARVQLNQQSLIVGVDRWEDS